METIEKAKRGETTPDEVKEAEEKFFAERIADKRLQVLEDSEDKNIVAQKKEVLRLLREQDIYILGQGDIESYYPATVTGPDKPSRAMNFCKLVKDKAALLRLCGDTICADGKTIEKEFNVIFNGIFARIG
jgi:hypothetical protein